MRTAFKIEELNEMLRLQKELREKYQIEEKDNLDVKMYLRIKTALFKLADEVGSFYLLKKEKDNKKQLKMAAKLLVTALNIIIEKEVELFEMNNQKQCEVDKYDMNEIFGMLDVMLSDMYFDDTWYQLNVFILTLGVVINKCGFDIKDLYDEYIKEYNEIYTKLV